MFVTRPRPELWHDTNTRLLLYTMYCMQRQRRWVKVTRGPSAQVKSEGKKTTKKGNNLTTTTNFPCDIFREKLCSPTSEPQRQSYSHFYFIPTHYLTNNWGRAQQFIHECMVISWHLATNLLGISRALHRAGLEQPSVPCASKRQWVEARQKTHWARLSPTGAVLFSRWLSRERMQSVCRSPGVVLSTA